jgi:hypothetical protein
MKLAPLLTLVAFAAASAATAGATPRFILDNGRASVVFPHGAPLKMTLTRETIPGMAPTADAMTAALPAQSWIENDGGQSFSVMVMRPGAYRLQHCPPPRTRKFDTSTMTTTCRLVGQGGAPVMENRTARDDGGLMLMRTFEVGDHRYAVAYHRVGVRLMAEIAGRKNARLPSVAEGEAFLDSFRLEKAAATH